MPALQLSEFNPDEVLREKEEDERRTVLVEKMEEYINAVMGRRRPRRYPVICANNRFGSQRKPNSFVWSIRTELSPQEMRILEDTIGIDGQTVPSGELGELRASFWSCRQLRVILLLISRGHLHGQLKPPVRLRPEYITRSNSGQPNLVRLQLPTIDMII
ncbi:hypothetical protein TWF506_000459 [Arthrobotrys conoides]|uniref:Uncharacterized protein n=1 Tax=Arthrobotrys conoides TaxID=74498 RepID=A0AAN8P869_9PEZI